ncbi:MAG: tyrosine-type recombinase/integrase [Clostridia bacterium]|nr:tyrosine-type recombinase/integrase [Clostridia bacterium]
MIAEFIEFMKKDNISENTYMSYTSDVKIYMKYYEDSYGDKMERLIHSDIIMYVNYLKRNQISARTINRKVAALKKYNLFLINKGIQKDIVIVDKDYIKIQKSFISKKIPTIQEMNKIQHSANKDEKNSERDCCFLAILTYGGLRESEMVTIRLVDIKLDERFINIIGKGNKFRQIIINDIMYDAIKRYLEIRKTINTDNPYLFVGQKNMKNKEPLNRNFCNRLLDKYKNLCKSVKIHPHLIRAFFCTNALHNAGYSIEQVANQAGHSSLNTTKEYLGSNDTNTLLDLANNL